MGGGQHSPNIDGADCDDVAHAGLVTLATQVQCRVLIADDNMDAAISLSFLLQNLGFDVRVVHDGVSAVRMVDTFEPHVGILDLGMPQLSGLEVAARIRTQSRQPGMRLIALTGWGQPEDRLKTREAGFDCHLTKPADLPDILRGIEGCMHDQEVGCVLGVRTE